MKSSSLIRPLVRRLHPYVPGEQPQGGKFIKLNTNENPYPASPAVARAIQAALERGLAKYPDPMAEAFRQVRRRFCTRRQCGNQQFRKMGASKQGK